MSMFDADHLQASVLKELAAAEIPADHRVAILVAADLTGSAHLIVALRGTDHWSLEVGGSIQKVQGEYQKSGAVAFKGSF